MPYNNYLNKYMKVSSLVSDAKIALNDDVILYYRTFKQMWGNGGKIWAVPGGIYTSNCPTDIVSIFYGRNEKVAVFVGHDLAYVIDKPNSLFFDDVKNMGMEFEYKAKDKYEIKIELPIKIK